MTDQEQISPTRQALSEALALSAEILSNIELNDASLTNIALKTSRLARLLNEFDFQKIMVYEAGGYPNAPDGVPPDVWKLGVLANRLIQQKDNKTGQLQEHIYLESIALLEEQLRVASTALEAARDPDISVSSTNPNQYVSGGIVNRFERGQIRGSLNRDVQRLANRRSFIYEYVLRKHYELKFSGIADDIFTRIRERVDEKIGKLLPTSIQKMSAVYESLMSDNPENWANAVHSCRRILQDLADALFPATNGERTIEVDGKKKSIKLGKDQYINRIIAFVEDSSDSERFEEIVGSHLSYLGERLDSVFRASQKGSHSEIVTRDEADRYVVFTYLLIGDILSLVKTTD